MEKVYQSVMVQEGYHPALAMDLPLGETRGKGIPMAIVTGWASAAGLDRGSEGVELIPAIVPVVTPARSFPVYGRLAIEGIRYPVQEFTFTRTADEVVAENHPAGHWPTITFRLKLREGTDRFDLASFRARSRGERVEAQILVTRVLLGLAAARRLRFAFRDVGEEISYELDISPNELKDIRNRAALYRKLAYIERTIHTTFSISEYIQPGTIRYVDELFKGITEGEFYQRAEGAMFDVEPKRVDLSAPPFRGFGSIEGGQNNPVTIFGRTFDIGPISFGTKYAQIGSPSELRKLRTSEAATVKVKFLALDYRLYVRFERFAALGQKKRQQALRPFLEDLRRDEPAAITESIYDPLIMPLDSATATRIAFGWLQINRLPDGICPEPPVLDIAAGHWSVPIAVKYELGASEPLAHLRIDLYSGDVKVDVGREALLQSADSAARRLLHAG